METINDTTPNVNTLPLDTDLPMTDAKFAQVVAGLLANPIAFHRIFVKIGGGVTPGLMLSQAWYWSKNKTAKARGGWFYKSAKEWEEETGLTRREQVTARRKLVERGLIQENLRGVPATLYFLVAEKEVIEAIKRVAEPQMSDSPEKVSVQASLAETCKLDSPKHADQFGGNVQTISETTSETSQRTHTQHLRAVGAPLVVVCGGSKFSLQDCRRYADHLHSSGQGITNPGGFARTIHKSGSEDEFIALWLAKLEPERVESGELPAPRDTSTCPDCHGMGWYYPNGAKNAVEKCKHPHLEEPNVGNLNSRPFYSQTA